MIGREDSREAGIFADFDVGFSGNGAAVVAMMLKRGGKNLWFLVPSYSTAKARKTTARDGWTETGY